MSDYNLIQKILLLPQIGNKSTLKIIESLNGNHSLNDIEIIDFIESLNLPRFKKLDSEQYARWQKNYETIFENNILNNIKTIVFNDEKYPNSLKQLKNFPLILNYKGNFEKLLLAPSVSVIGTREPTEYGKKIGFRIGEVLAERGINVVSGLAVGCDALGHKGALNKNGFTCAILAHGLQEIYPKQNIDLAERILAQDGLLVSEYPYGMPPTKNSFVERDRIQAGLSNSTVVIETGIKGGTMHAVNTTLELGRNLFCVAHPEKYKTEDKVQGNIKLIQDNLAKPLGTKEDLENLISISQTGGDALKEALTLF